MKYYSVRQGRVPGIYESWEACREQVQGFSGAVYKSFASREEAKAFLLGDASPAKEEPVCPEIYVDGSFRADTGEYAYGMVILWEGETRCFKEKFPDPEMATMRNVAGEIRGAQAAMEYALSEGWPEIVIYHDYAGIAKWCTGEWKANKEGTAAYRDFYRSIQGRLKVRFVKVKGHSHDRYNDMADSLAKEALGIE